VLAATLALGGTALAGGLQHTAPGHDGTAVTSIGYRVTPAGKQTNLGDLPLVAVSSPDGRWLVVSNPAPKALFVGLAFARDGKTLYASGGGNNLIRRYTVTGGTLAEGTPIPLPTTDPTGAKINPLPAGIALTPDGHRLLVADQQADALSAVDLVTGAVHTTAAGHRPYAVVASADGHSAYVTDQGTNTVSVLDLTGPEPAPQKTITVGTHPNKVVASADGRTLYVANGDSDEISVIDTATAAVTRTISLAPYQGAQDGSNPDALALSRDGRTLYVANAGNNDVSAQGWNWSVAANSNPYAEQVWPSNYSDRGAPYPTESGDPAIAPNRDPAQAYIWDRLAAAKISFRNYGFYVDPQPDGSSKATDPLLNANTDPAFRGFDLACPDSPNSFTPRKANCGSPRFTEWKKEFDGYAKGDNLPTVELLRLPNDHNAGTKARRPHPSGLHRRQRLGTRPGRRCRIALEVLGRHRHLRHRGRCAGRARPR